MALKDDKEIKRYPSWAAVPKGLTSKSRLARVLRLSAANLEPVAQVYQMIGHRWIDLYPVKKACPKRRLSDGKKAALIEARRYRWFWVCKGCSKEFHKTLQPPRWQDGWCDECFKLESRQFIEYISNK